MYWLSITSYDHGDGKWLMKSFESFGDAFNWFLEEGYLFSLLKDFETSVPGSSDFIKTFLFNGGIIGDEGYRIEIILGEKEICFIELYDGKEALSIEDIVKNKNNAEYWVNYWSSIGKPVKGIK